MSESDSSLTPPPPTDDEMAQVAEPVAAKASPHKKKRKSKKNANILSFFKTEDPPSPPRKKRPASPPHELVAEDNPDIGVSISRVNRVPSRRECDPSPDSTVETRANISILQFIIMFRSRFNDVFPPKTPNFGPQDIERGVADELPSSQIESLLCALLGLVLNRKKPVEKGHYGRALEEAIQTHKPEWPKAWGSINPLSGGRSFNTMAPSERITLFKALILWSLHSCEAIKATIAETYKSRSTKDKNDTNIPLSVQPWGRDGDKRRYWLVEGRDDTSFRVYRESNPLLKTVHWWSVAGSIDEIRTLAQKLLDDDGTKEAKALSEKMLNAIPRFEATEVKRKRREYRVNRVAAFTRPEPGFSLYEGRTRGKRLKYTYSDEEDYGSDATSVRRSGRHTSAVPSGPAGPTVTASGRHVRSRATGLYGESLLSGQTTERASPATGEYVRSEGSEEPQAPAHGRSTRAAAHATNGWEKGRKHIETYNDVDEMDDEEDASSSGGEWDGGDEGDDDQMDVDEEDVDDESSEDDDAEPRSLVVHLKYHKGPHPASTSAQPVHHEQHASSATEHAASHPMEPTPGPSLESAPVPTPAPIPTQQLPSISQAIGKTYPLPQHPPPPAAPIALPHPVPMEPAVVPRPVPQMTNGFPAHQAHILNPLPPAPPAQSALPPPHMQPKQPSSFAPTPPYGPSEVKPQVPTVVGQEASTPYVPPTSLPNPTPASSWQ
ncbi:hypothetical protein EJ04DRAFT_510669 [Polyplosphaeria fusca]|uniref:WHIM1 domain-containing protein n=1 Tax=Polyplosphaeria fusca TaxID=682080 RepID=A0A9P4R581_9PLEO|nr:hypothetical protein EJ04DRAFT_510669 [Polyplosphaeria fusca]